MPNIKNRPYLIHFHCILVKTKLSIRLGISSRPSRYFSDDELSPSIPIRDFRLLSKNKFTAKIVIEFEGSGTLEKTLDTDQFGHLNYRFSLADYTVNHRQNAKVSIYETSVSPGFDLFLGSQNPKSINTEKAVIISDFDKTLVDTKYKTTIELYHSLTSRLDEFPTVEKTLEQIHPMYNDGHPLFIVSASPHFYENSIRHWLKSQNIHDAGIF